MLASIECFLPVLCVLQVWCHCHDCRKWHQTTPIPAVIFPEECIQVVSGEDKIAEFRLRKRELVRSFCKANFFHKKHNQEMVVTVWHIQ